MKSAIYYKIKRFIQGFFTHLFLISVALTCLYPLLWVFFGSFKTQESIFNSVSIIPEKFHFENYYFALIKGDFSRYFFNSVIYTIIVVIAVVVISSMAGYAFSRLRFFGRRAAFLIFMAAMMVPLPGSFVALFILLNKLHLRDTPLGYILCMINVGLPISIFMLKTFFDTMPKEIEDAACIDGCSKIGIWRHMALPLARPVLAVVIIINTLNVWNEYILALVVFDNKNFMPLQRALVVFQGEFLTNYPLLMAGLTITAMPVVIVYILMQKHIVKGVTSKAFFG
ncbi:MAG: carbohydrate ABC transporter permease [Candidatus Omnitrophota bacterium]